MAQSLKLEQWLERYLTIMVFCSFVARSCVGQPPTQTRYSYHLIYLIYFDFISIDSAKAGQQPRPAYLAA